MTDLYTQSDIRAIRRRVAVWRAITAAVAVGVLAAAVLLALTATTATEGRNELIVIISSAVGGWIVFYSVNFIILASRRELAHAAMLASEPPAVYTGRVAAAGGRFRIRKSITVRKFTFETDGGETLSLSISDAMARRFFELAADGVPVEVRAVHNYVAAYAPAGEGKEAAK